MEELERRTWSFGQPSEGTAHAVPSFVLEERRRGSFSWIGDSLDEQARLALRRVRHGPILESSSVPSASPNRVESDMPCDPEEPRTRWTVGP